MTPNKQLVEVVARALTCYCNSKPCIPQSQVAWDMSSEAYKNAYREQAQAAIRAIYDYGMGEAAKENALKKKKDCDTAMEAKLFEFVYRAALNALLVEGE